MGLFICSYALVNWNKNLRTITIANDSLLMIDVEHNALNRNCNGLLIPSGAFIGLANVGDHSGDNDVIYRASG